MHTLKHHIQSGKVEFDLASSRPGKKLISVSKHQMTVEFPLSIEKLCPSLIKHSGAPLKLRILG